MVIESCSKLSRVASLAAYTIMSQYVMQCSSRALLLLHAVGNLRSCTDMGDTLWLFVRSEVML